MGENKFSFKNIDFSNIKKLINKDIKELRSSNEKSEKKISVSNKKLPKKLIGFDIGSKSTKVVVGKKGRDKLVVDRLLSIPTPEGMMLDGKIFNVKNLSEVIGYILEQEKLGADNAICTAKSSTIINREIIIPKVEDEEMETVIKYEIQQYLPIDLNDYILQYKVIDNILNEAGEQLKVNVIAFPEKMAKAYYDLLLELDLKPFALDVDYNSIDKLMDFNTEINNYECNAENTIAFIDIGATSINLTIYKDGKIDFTRMIKSGGDNIDYELSNKLSMSAKATESIKIEKANLHNISKVDDVNTTIVEVIGEWISEIDRILLFYKNKNLGKEIDTIYIYGGSSNIKGLCTLMTERLGIKTRRINGLNNIQISSKELNEPIEQYINAIGSLIRY